MNHIEKRRKITSEAPATKAKSRSPRLSPSQDDSSSDSRSPSRGPSCPPSDITDEEEQEQEQEEEKLPQTFKDLGIVDNLCESCASLGYKKPTAIQAKAIPVALEGRDVIGIAETGSGKTAAFALPILQALLDKPQPFFAVVLAPTRELASQISQTFEALGALISLRCALIVGGLDMAQQAIALGRKPHVIVATPGRLVDHLMKTKGFTLRLLKYLVMDEADRLLDLDFGPSIDKLLKFIPVERRTFLFSATVSSKVEKLQRASLRDPVRVSVSTNKYQTVSTLLQHYLFIPSKFRTTYLVYLMKHDFAGRTAIVFVHTRRDTERIAIMLRKLGFGAIPLHGQLSQSARLAALNKFRERSKDILVATDVAARGLDIPMVDLVLNFDLPLDSKTYIHRVGRTARAGKSGRAINFVTQYNVRLYQAIEKALGKELPEHPTEKAEVMVYKELVEEAERLARSEMREMEQKKKSGQLKGKGASRKRKYDEERDREEA